MKKFLIKMGIWAFSLFLLFNGIALLSLYSLNRSDFYKPQYLGNLKPGIYNYVVLGASNGLTTLNTKVIDSTIGTKGFNLSLDDSNLGSQYLMLKHFYELGNKTDFCILAILGGLDEPNPKINDNDFRFLPLLNNLYVQEYFRDMDQGYKPLYLSNFTPIYGVSLYNYELFFPSILSFINPRKRNRFDQFGNYSYPSTTKKKLPIEDKVIKKISITNPFFYKIKQICKANNTKLILYQSPLYNVEVILTDRNYLFINHSKEYFPLDMYYDNLHVDSKGSYYCSLKFADEFENIKNVKFQ